MKLFTSQSLPEVELRRMLLAEQGIATLVRNQYVSMASGEVPFTDTWPELWLVDEKDWDQARAILSIQPATADSTQEWTCAGCGEISDGQFGACWNCSHERL